MFHILVLALFVACEATTLPPNCTINTNIPINCTIEAGRAEVECPKENVIRVIGAYQNFSIHCSSESLLMFQYDGTKPTEAIRINTWVDPAFVNDANQIPKTVRQHIKVEVLSVRSLIAEYTLDKELSNITISPEIYYSRSGEFIFDLITKSNVTAKVQFFIFFEEPYVDPAFINRYERNEGLKEIDAGNYFVSCRSTCYAQPVGWSKPQLWMETTEGMKIQKMAVFDPTAGFSFSSSEDQVRPNTTFLCIIPHESDQSKNIEFDPTEKSSVVHLAYRTVSWVGNTTHKLSYFTKNEKQHVSCTPSESTLNVIAARNPDEFVLVRDFVLPTLANRSLYLEKGMPVGEGGVETHHGTSQDFGALYCGGGGDHKLKTFMQVIHLSGFDGFYFDYDWKQFNGEHKIFRPEDIGPAIVFVEPFLQPDHHHIGRLNYECEDFEAKCQVHSFYLRPVVWEVLQNESVIRQVENDVTSKPSTFTTRLNQGHAIISCFAANWVWRGRWAQATTNVTVLACEEPKFEKTQPMVYEFEPDAAYPRVEITAHGIPIPTIACVAEFFSQESNEVEKSLASLSDYWIEPSTIESTFRVIDSRRTKLNCEATNARGVDNITIHIRIKLNDRKGLREMNARGRAGKVSSMYDFVLVGICIWWTLTTIKML